jgi:hypothetical protein
MRQEASGEKAIGLLSAHMREVPKAQSKVPLRLALVQSEQGHREVALHILRVRPSAS